MPHLSPMNWVLVPLIMISILVIMMVIMWWQYLPKFPIMVKFNSSSQLKIKKWNWW